MPAIPKGSLVLVTGASGFIAAHTVQAFLHAGYPVRGTVRSTEKGEYLSRLFQHSTTPFEYVIVEDIELPGAFDQAVMHVKGVAHMASPFVMDADDPAQLIGPAVGGTVGILKSLAKTNPEVCRVVITSSCAAIVDDNRPTPFHYTKEHWNEHSPRECEKKGREASGGDKYRASKTLAERAFWQYLESENPTFDGVTINPPMVYGPIIHPVNRPEALNTSVAVFYDWLCGSKRENDIPSTAVANFVDVRDLALAHVRALEVPEAGGQRFICSAGPASPNDLCLAIHRHFPQFTGVPHGDPSKVKEINKRSNVFDASKATRVLGVTFRGIDDSVNAMGESLIRRFNL